MCRRRWTQNQHAPPHQQHRSLLHHHRSLLHHHCGPGWEPGWLGAVGAVDTRSKACWCTSGPPAHPAITIRPPDDQHLPTANTCISRLYVPLYSSKQILKQKLLLAIKTKNFGFV